MLLFTSCSRVLRWPATRKAITNNIVPFLFLCNYCSSSHKRKNMSMYTTCLHWRVFHVLNIVFLFSIFWCVWSTQKRAVNNSQTTARNDAQGSRIFLLRHGTERWRADRQQQRWGLSLLQNTTGHWHALLHRYVHIVVFSSCTLFNKIDVREHVTYFQVINLNHFTTKHFFFWISFSILSRWWRGLSGFDAAWWCRHSQHQLGQWQVGRADSTPSGSVWR